jgi:hypothetical protein
MSSENDSASLPRASAAVKDAVAIEPLGGTSCAPVADAEKYIEPKSVSTSVWLAPTRE